MKLARSSTVAALRKSPSGVLGFDEITGGAVVGVVALYAYETEFFHEGEMKLLTELTGDIAYAIDHIEKQERLDYLAYYDVLTGLANRALFLERTAQYIRGAASGRRKLALFLIDLERFKNINDSLGRPAGDLLLKQVAQWLTRAVGDANLPSRAPRRLRGKVSGRPGLGVWAVETVSSGVKSGARRA
jgi:predicted signal transduction protein with EAL and GGDEF domain